MDGLRQYATEKQLEYLEAIEEHGSSTKAADILGVNRRTIDRSLIRLNKRAAKQGYSPEHDMAHPVPDGFKLRGTSTLYDDDGNVKIQWVKSQEDKERQIEIIQEACEAFASELPKESPVKAPNSTQSNLYAAYPVGDLHIGMLAHAEETLTEDGDYDLSIAESMLMGATDYLVNSSPACGRAGVVLLGDFMHFDSMKAQTPRGTPLDADSRFHKVVRTAIRCVRYMIKACLAKHGQVDVIVEVGNHDTASSVFLREALHNIYEDDDRVNVDTSPARYHYIKFGQNLIGVHHGDGAKMANLPLIMAQDRKADWGDSQHRTWWTGHIHHETAKDFHRVKVESFRILPPEDAWAAGMGYRSIQDQKAIILHEDHGEVSRHTVNPEMLK
jgi:hypothetical protein